MQQQVYGEHVLPATMYEIKKTLRNPSTIKGFDKNGAPIYINSKQRLKTIFSRHRNRLSSLDSSTSTIEVSTEYASHFYDMYIRQHDGKHMTGDRMKTLMLNLPFLTRDLLRPEVRYIDIILTYFISATISYPISYRYPISRPGGTPGWLWNLRPGSMVWTISHAARRRGSATRPA
jgi:hypothetical protein